MARADCVPTTLHRSLQLDAGSFPPTAFNPVAGTGLAMKTLGVQGVDAPGRGRNCVAHRALSCVLRTDPVWGALAGMQTDHPRLPSEGCG